MTRKVCNSLRGRLCNRHVGKKISYVHMCIYTPFWVEGVRWDLIYISSLFNIVCSLAFGASAWSVFLKTRVLSVRQCFCLPGRRQLRPIQSNEGTLYQSKHHRQSHGVACHVHHQVLRWEPLLGSRQRLNLLMKKLQERFNWKTLHQQTFATENQSTKLIAPKHHLGQHCAHHMALVVLAPGIWVHSCNGLGQISETHLRRLLLEQSQGVLFTRVQSLKPLVSCQPVRWPLPPSHPCILGKLHVLVHPILRCVCTFFVRLFFFLFGQLVKALLKLWQDCIWGATQKHFCDARPASKATNQQSTESCKGWG